MRNVSPIHSFASTEIRAISAEAKPPTVTQYDHWGRRIDKLETCEAWRKLKAVAQEEGIVAIAFERQHGEFSRVHGFVKQIMMVGDAQVVSSSALASRLPWFKVISGLLSAQHD